MPSAEEYDADKAHMIAAITARHARLAAEHKHSVVGVASDVAAGQMPCGLCGAPAEAVSAIGSWITLSEREGRAHIVVLEVWCAGCALLVALPDAKAPLSLTRGVG